MKDADAENKYQISSSLPSVEQILELQRIGVVTAKEQEKLKESPRSDNTHLFLAKQIEGYLESEISGEPYYWAHRFIGRVARTGYRQWSMRIAESFWVQDESVAEGEEFPSKINDGYRASYIFEWKKDEVLRALMSIHARDLYDTQPVDGEIDQPDLCLPIEDIRMIFTRPRPLFDRQKGYLPIDGNTQNDYLQIVKDTANLSAGDCNLLAQDMLRFSELTLSENR